MVFEISFGKRKLLPDSLNFAGANMFKGLTLTHPGLPSALFQNRFPDANTFLTRFVRRGKHVFHAAVKKQGQLHFCLTDSFSAFEAVDYGKV